MSSLDDIASKSIDEIDCRWFRLFLVAVCRQLFCFSVFVRHFVFILFCIYQSSIISKSLTLSVMKYSARIRWYTSYFLNQQVFTLTAHCCKESTYIFSVVKAINQKDKCVFLHSPLHHYALNVQKYRNTIFHQQKFLR
jgi:hypothetical protein